MLLMVMIYVVDDDADGDLMTYQREWPRVRARQRTGPRPPGAPGRSQAPAPPSLPLAPPALLADAPPTA